MKGVWTGLTVFAAAIGLLYGTSTYLESREHAVKTVVADALMQYEQAKRVEYLLHLARTYRYRMEHAKTRTEYEHYKRLLDEVEQDMEQLGRR